jgi:Double zinc ribbon
MAEPTQAQIYDVQGHPLAMDRIAEWVSSGTGRFQKGVRVYALNPVGDLVTVAPEDVGSPGYKILTPAQLRDEYAQRHPDAASLIRVTLEPAEQLRPAAQAGDIVGVLVGALLWPWLFSKLLRAVGMAQHGAVWAGYLVGVAVAAGAHGANGFPTSYVATFVVAGFLFSAWASGKKPPSRAPQNQVESDAAGEPALPELIGDIEDGKAALKESRPRAPPRESSLPDLPDIGRALAASAPSSSRNCAACGGRNDDDAKHCIRCGKPMDHLVCPSCAQNDVLDARFCKGCGRQLMG